MALSAAHLLVIVLGLVAVDIFCSEIPNTKQSNSAVWPAPNNQKPARGNTREYAKQNAMWLNNEQQANSGIAQANANKPNAPAQASNSPKQTQTAATQKPISSSSTVKPNLPILNVKPLVQGSKVAQASVNKAVPTQKAPSSTPPTNVRNNPTQGTRWVQQNNLWVKNNQQTTANPTANTRPKSYAQAARGNSNVPQSDAPTDTATKWVQQNNIWVRNEQANSGKAQTNIVPSSTTSKTLISPNNPPSLTVGGVKPVISSTGQRGTIEEGGNVEAGGQDSSVSDNELREFSETLLQKDSSNNAAKYVTVNLQGMTTSRSEKDEAPMPLLSVDQAAYKLPSIEKMALLHNNYFLAADQNEVYTGQERIEENNFLDAILSTPVMQHTRNFLIQKGKLGKDPKDFKDTLRLIWFNMYSRGGGRIGSSGFEHVFVAELKNNMVSGLHNWLYFNEEEKNNRANYLGYMKKIDLGDKGSILKYHFTFHDVDKPVGSMFIGTSPELEMALYSTCFLLRADKICPLKMNGNNFIIRTFAYRYRGKNMIGSAFPEI